MSNYHAGYLSFFDLYHNEEYWEAHETLEELWQTQRENKFYHGLIQIAAIMHQIRRNKVRGARKLAASALIYLRPYVPYKDGVFVKAIVEWLEKCLEILPLDVEFCDTRELGITICPLPLSPSKISF